MSESIEASTAGGLLLVLLLALPVLAMLLALVVGGRHAARVAFATLPIGLVLSVAIVVDLVRSGTSVVYLLGGWAPPLGIALRADGLSAVMLLTTTVLVAAVAVFAHDDFRHPAGPREARAPLMFWSLLLAVWGALNTVFLAGDLFTLFVALELLTFAAVPLVCLDGRAETLQAALRYLLFALIGSLVYLLGTALIYGAYGTLDVVLLAQRVQGNTVVWVAAALMTLGLIAKSALVPFHLWLPPAHAGAPAAGSALLSALVVKGSFFLIVRLWLDVLPEVAVPSAAQLLGALGAAAILLGNAVALRQARLKLLIAYSTVAQLGYLFLMFPLATALSALQQSTDPAITGGLLQAVSHATAKAAMFLGAGLIYTVLGHDRIAELRGIARLLPMTVLAFALAGASLIGLPPSLGFLAKWLLLSTALSTGQWWWGLVMVVGGLLTSVYVFKVLLRAMTPATTPLEPRAPVPRYREAVVLGLAVLSFTLGFVALAPVNVVVIGRGMGLP